MTKRHTHKYYKAYGDSTKKSFLWTCALPDCTHHMPKHYEKSIHGKLSLCYSCESDIVLDPIRLDMDKPLCDECMNRTSIPVEPVTEEINSDLKNDPIEERLRQLL